MRRVSVISVLVFVIVLAAGVGLAIMATDWRIALGAFAIALLLALSIQIARQWQQVVVLRLGRFSRLAGPGPFGVLPFIDTISHWIDTRVITTPFRAEETLTKDNVPVDVDAVLFSKVFDPKKAALEVFDYMEAISWAAQTALRDIIGKTMLSEMLVGRERLDTELRGIIDHKTEPWGITVQSVEIRDVLIPAPLQDAMSKQAQAERERQARIILSESETQIAAKFDEAAQTYLANPTALHLRAMNMLYEGLREKGSLIIVPSSALETMNLGVVGGLASLTKENGGETSKEVSATGGEAVSETPVSPGDQALPISP